MAAKPKSKVLGRPSDYSEEVAVKICDRIIETGTLKAALMYEGMPDNATVFRWLAKHESFRDLYARAREAATENDSEELRRLAYDPDMPPDQKRIAVDVLKWTMARRAPKKWGDRQTVDLNATLKSADELTDAELAQKVRSGG